MDENSKDGERDLIDRETDSVVDLLFDLPGLSQPELASSPEFNAVLNARLERMLSRSLRRAITIDGRTRAA